MAGIRSARLQVGEPVARDDGRFYVPVSTDAPNPGLSSTVLRVASDAFNTVEEAQVFADLLVSIWNNEP